MTKDLAGNARPEADTDPLQGTLSSSQTDRRHGSHRGCFQGGHQDGQQQRESKPPQEAPGHSKSSRTAIVGQAPYLDDLSDEQLKATQAKRRLKR